MQHEDMETLASSAEARRRGDQSKLRRQQIKTVFVLIRGYWSIVRGLGFNTLSNTLRGLAEGVVRTIKG